MDVDQLAMLRERRRVFHGLRKSAVAMLLGMDCAGTEVAAITEQSHDLVEHDARRANQLRLAASAVLKWEAERSPARNGEKPLN
jgi:hypothetical protein